MHISTQEMLSPPAVKFQGTLVHGPIMCAEQSKPQKMAGWDVLTSLVSGARA